jgi:hypothetical protein
MDTHVIRLHFTDGTTQLSGTLLGGTPDKVDASFAKDVNAGWDLGRGLVVPDGRIVRSFSAEHESIAVRSAA